MVDDVCDVAVRNDDHDGGDSDDAAYQDYELVADGVCGWQFMTTMLG